MTAWRSRVFVGLLALLALPSAAAGDASSTAAPSAQQRVELSAAMDFGDGPRLPLTALGAQLGVIVTLTGEYVNIVHPDGVEVRLKGATAEASPLDAERPVLLIRQDDAWAAAEDLARLLGVAGALTPDGSRFLASQAPPGGPSFKTFEVAKPVVVSRPEVHTPEEQQPRRRLPEINPGGEADTVLTEMAPVEVGLGLTEMSSFSGPGMTGFWQKVVRPGWFDVNGGPRELRCDSPVRHTLSYFALDVYEGDQTYLVGDISDPLFGTATGIEMRSALSDKTSLGAAALVPDERLGVDTAGQLALKAETTSGSGLATEASIATDGSFLLSGRWERPGTSLRSHIIDSYGIRRRDLSWEHQALPAVSVFGRVAEADGSYEARASLVALQWRLGHAHLNLDRARGVSAGEPWGTDAVSLSVLRGRTSGALRYVLPGEPTGRKGLEWYLSRFDPSGRQIFLSSSAPTRGQWDSGRSYRLGASYPITRGLRLRAAVDWDREGVHPEAKFEWRPSRDKVIALRYGVFDSGLASEAAESALVLQAGFAFGPSGRVARRTGRVLGRVKDDRGHGVADVAVVLQEVAVTFTRSDGTYEFRQVDPGRQTVRIDRDRLHANLGGDLRPRVVYVRDDATERADFVVTRLCQIAGTVYMQSESGEQRQPLAGAAVELSDGQRATTNSEGRYTFGGLKPGRYTITLASTTDMSVLTPLAPTSWSFNLAPGDQVAGADFGFTSRQRPVIFDLVSSEY